jgi:hypothetical protein
MPRCDRGQLGRNAHPVSHCGFVKIRFDSDNEPSIVTNERIIAKFLKEGCGTTLDMQL